MRGTSESEWRYSRDNSKAGCYRWTDRLMHTMWCLNNKLIWTLISTDTVSKVDLTRITELEGLPQTTHLSWMACLTDVCYTMRGSHLYRPGASWNQIGPCSAVGGHVRWTVERMVLMTTWKTGSKHHKGPQRVLLRAERSGVVLTHDFSVCLLTTVNECHRSLPSPPTE